MPFARVAAARLEPLLDREADAARRAGRDAPALIDLGCGTGTLLAEVRRTRPAWRLAGVDASAGMLAVARAKLAAAKLDVKLAGTSDVTFARTHLGAPLPFSAAFDVCTAFYDTLNHLLDTEALARTFAVAATVLRPGGLLVFDVTSRHGFEDWWEASNTFTGAGWRMSIDAGFDRATEIATADVTVERGGRTGRLPDPRALLRPGRHRRRAAGRRLRHRGRGELVALPDRRPREDLVGRPPRLMTPFGYKATHSCR